MTGSHCFEYILTKNDINPLRQRGAKYRWGRLKSVAKFRDVG